MPWRGYASRTLGSHSQALPALWKEPGNEVRTTFNIFQNSSSQYLLVLQERVMASFFLRRSSAKRYNRDLPTSLSVYIDYRPTVGLLSMVCNLIPKPKEEEKGPGCSHSRMHLIIADLSTCSLVGGY